MKIKNKKKSAETSLSLIIHGKNNQICVDSRDIAREFGRRHDNVLQTIKNLLEDGTVSFLECKERKYKKLGREYRCFELNEAGFLKAMPFIGGKKSKEGQKRLVDEFLSLRNRLDKQSKEREKLSYQVARSSGKNSRLILTDAIQKFIDYAKSQGSVNSQKYFPNITKMVHKTIVILEPRATEVRELMTAIQLATLSLIELTAAQSLTEGMEAQQPYKEIFQKLKNALDGFTQKANILGG